MDKLINAMLMISIILVVTYGMVLLYLYLSELFRVWLGLPVKLMSLADCSREAFRILIAILRFVVKVVVDIFKPDKASVATQPIPPYQMGNAIYQQLRADYENFACILLSYLKIIQSRCHLCCPANADGIHCAEIADRVKNLNGITFQYEVPCEETLYEGGMKAATPSVDTDRIAEMLRRNLQDCMTGGYYFNGDINVWPVGKDYVRIEVQGVWRDDRFEE